MRCCKSRAYRRTRPGDDLLSGLIAANDHSDRLSEDDLKKIVEIQLRRLSKRLEQQKIMLELSDSAKAFIAREGYDPVYGARPLKRAVQRHILDPLSLDILEGKFGEGQTIRVDEKSGTLKFTVR